MLVILGAWIAFIVGFVIVWARLHARHRRLLGVDEDAYVNGHGGIPSEAAVIG